MSKKRNLNTISVHAGHYLDENVPGLASPIFTATAHKFPNKNNEPYYPRWNNMPNHLATSNKIAALENGKHGLVFSSGIAAISSVLFACLKAGDHAIVQSHIYGGAHNLFEEKISHLGIEVSFVDSMDAKDYQKEIKKNTKVIYIETPSNPLLKIIDIEAIAKLAKAEGLTSIIDNTFASPINQNPLDLGIDVAVHSCTKYLGGHSDIIAGAMVTNSETLFDAIKISSAKLGGTLDAFATYRLERSIKTLALRMERHNFNAIKIAEFLSNEKKVKKVNYPGLSSHEGYEIAKKQMSGFSGMLSFDLNMDHDQIKERMQKFKYIAPGISLGGVESIACFPCETSHALVPKKIREKYGITESLVRLSVGIEDVEDLITDLKHLC